MIKWENGGVGVDNNDNGGNDDDNDNNDDDDDDGQHSVPNNLPLMNKRCSPVSVITSPSCQLRTPTPNHNIPLQTATMTATTTITTATSVLIKSESIDWLL